MMKIKTAQFDQQPDFANTGMRTGVRRLMGALIGTRDAAMDAHKILERRISNREFDLTVEEVQADHNLAFALDRAMGNEWQKLLTGTIL